MTEGQILRTPNDQTICVNDAVPALSVTAPGATEFYWYSDSFLTTIAPGSNNTNTYNTGIGSATPSTTTFYVTQVQGSINGCVSLATPVTLTINSLPNAITGPNAVCVGSTIDLDNTTAGGTWSSSNPGRATVNSSTGVVTGVSAGTTSIRYTLGTGCFRAVTVTVNGLPNNITGTTSVCVGSTTTLANTTPGGTWSSSDTAVATINSSGVVTGVAQGTSEIRYTLGTGCYRAVTVTVNSLPGVITGTTSVCVGSTTTLSSSPAGGTWSSATPARATVNASGVVTGVSAGTVTISYTLGTGCYRSVTVTVRPLPTLTGATQAAICSGSAATISLTGLLVSTTFTINYTIDGAVQAPATGIVSNASGAASFTTPALNYAAHNGKILRITSIAVTSTTPNCTVTFNRDVTLVVRPLPTLSGASQSPVCSGSAAIINLTGLLASSTSTVSYTIDGTAQTPVTGVVANASGAASFPTPALNYATHNGKILQITGITITSASPNCLGAFAQNVTLNVEPLLLPGSVGSDQSKCNPANPDAFTQITPASGGLAPYSYQWRSSTTAGGPYSDIGSATGITYDPPAGLGVTTYYVRRVSSAGVCASVISNEIRVTVNPSAASQVRTLSGPNSACKGTTITMNYQAVTNADQYVWDYSWTGVGVDATTGTPTITIDLSIAGPGVVPPGAYTIRVAGINGCNVPADYPWSAFHNLTVNEIPDLSPLSATKCSDLASGITLTLANAGPYCTDWRYNITAINSGALTASAGTPATGINLLPDVIADDAWTNTTGANVGVIYTIAPVSQQGCTGAAENVTFTVQSEPKGTNATLSTCSDVALNYNIQNLNINQAPPNGNSQPSTFTWVAADNPNVTGESTTSQSTGVINNVLNNVSGSDQIVTYTVVPTGTNGCAGNSFTVTVTVKSEPKGSDVTIPACSDVAVGYNLQTSNINVAPGNSQLSTFSWIAAANPNVTGESTTAQTGNTISDIIHNVTGSNQTVIYTVTPTGTNGCVGNSFLVTVTVGSEPTGGAGTTNACSDNALGYNLQTANINVLGNGQASNFSWVAAANPNVTGESTSAQSGGIINDNINNVSGSDQLVVYTVTPTGTNGCVGNSFQVTATIRSEPLGAHDDLLICSDVALNYNLQTANINTLGNGQASTFSWVAAANFNVGGESTVAKTTGSITDVLTNITGGNEIVTYAVTPTGSNGCAGNTFTVSVTVKPEPVITAGQNVAVCSDNPMNYEIQLDNFGVPATDGVTFTWGPPVLNPVSPLFTGGSARGIASSANITDTYVNTMGSLGTATYSITPYKDGCPGNQVDVVVTIGAEPILDPNLNKFACSGQPISLTLQKAAGSVVPTYYNITGKTVSPGLTESGNALLPKGDAAADYLLNDKYTNTTSVNQTVTYHAQPVLAPDCFGDFVDIVITIRPPVMAGAITGNDDICYNTDAPVISNAVVASGGDGAIVYSWYYTENLSLNPTDAGWTLIVGASASSYDPGILTNSTKYVRKAVDGSCPDEVYSTMITITVNPLPVTPVITGDTVLCENAANKIYKVTNNPGSTYTWTVPDSLDITSPPNLYFIIVDALGASLPGDKITVTETLTSTTGCVGLPVEFPIIISPVMPGVVVSGPLDVCQGDSGVIYSVPWHTGSSYSWSIPAGAYITSDPDSSRIAVTYNMALSGQVSVIETSGSVCTTVHVPVSVLIHALPNVYSVSASPYYCFGTGGVTVTLNNSQTGVNYQLYKNGTAEGAPIGGNTGSPVTWNNMTFGTYTVRATSAASPFCTTMMNGSITVEENPQMLISTIDVTQPKCFGGTDGKIVINVTGGFPPVTTLTYSIDGGATFVASNTFNVGAGTYDIVVKDLRNCTISQDDVTVSQPTELTVTSVTQVNAITCFGYSDGSARVVASGGTLIYSYQWYYDAFFASPVPGQTSDLASGLPAGTFYVKVTDANGCWKSGSVTLAQPAVISATAAITSNFNGAHISCNGANNAEITVTASGGTGILSYLLVEAPANVTGAASGVFTGVGPGTYTVRVRDINLCEKITNAVIVIEPAVITASAAVTSNYNGSHITCNGASDGRITVTASGGTGALKYAINEIPGNLTGLNTGIFTGVPAGNYIITVTDKNSCTTTTPVSVVAPVAVTINASVSKSYNGSDVSCYGASDGQITAVGNGGTGTLTYMIVQLPGNLTGASSGIFTGVPAGTYTIRATDVNGCSATTTNVVLTNPAAITITGSVTSNYNGSQVSCFGSTDGRITATASGGTGTLTYVLDQDPANVTGVSSGIFTGLGAGTYTITVTDLNLCTKTTANIIISNPTAVNATAAITSNYNGSHISCNGANNAEIRVTASGGTGALSYVLVEAPANVTGATTGIFTGVGPGTYTVRVRDLNSCEKITNAVTVVEPAVITASAAVTSNYNGSHITCNGASDGRITVTASGGTGVLTYAINEIPGNLTGLNTGIFSGVPAGNYIITVTDKNSCTTTTPVSVVAPAAVTITASVTSNYNGSDVSCSGSSDGKITAVGGGGTGTLTYSIVQLPGNLTGALSGEFTGIPAGTYTLRVTDANGCTLTAPDVTIDNPAALTISGSVTSNYNGSQVSCFGSTDGRITVTATGGTGTLTYTLDQDPANVTGASSGIFTGLAAGTWTITVTDANLCTKKTPNIVITNPAAVNATIAITSNYNGSHISCNGANNAEITVTASGGTGILSYLLVEAPANVTGAASGVFTGVGPGTYTVRVRDINLCEKITNAVIVIEPAVITASAAVTSNYNGSHITCNGASDGRITVTASGGTGALKYAINEIPGNLTGLNTGIFTGVPAGNYIITVTDKNSCTTTTPVSVVAPVAVTINASVSKSYNGSDVSCYGASDGQITAVGNGGTGTLTYMIVQLPGNLTGASSGIFTGVPAGTYTIRATDVNGCSATTTNVVLTNPAAITITGSVTSNYNGSQVSCFGSTDGRITATASGGTGTLTYVLDQDPANVTGVSSGIFTGLGAGTYTITVTDLNLCTKTTTNIIIANPAVIITNILITSNYNGSHLSCNGASDGEITVTASGGTGTLSFLLVEMPANVSGATTGIFTGVPAGTYTITVSDENGCAKTTAPVTLVNPPVITASAAVTSNFNGSQLSCFGASDGRLTVTASGGTGTLSYLLNEIPANITGLITGIFTGLPAGPYTVTVTDKNLCSEVTAPVTITAPLAITVNASVTSDYNGSDVSCYGSSDGEITALASGGTGALSYAIVQMPGNLTGTSSGVFTGVPAGTFTIRVTDVNACFVVSTDVIVANPAAITATGLVTSSYNGSQVSCFGASDGEITITANGGTGTLSYILDQDPVNVTGAISGVFTGLPAGTYTVTVTDENGCTKKTPAITISNPTAVIAVASVTSNHNGSHISCFGASDGEITINATGGTGTLAYVLNQIPGNITGASSGVFTGLPAGSYTVTVTDANLCSLTTVPVSVIEPAAVTATAAVTSNYFGSQLSCNGASDGRITVTASGGTGALSYALVEIPANTSGAITGVFTGLPAGPYTVTVTDVNGCSVVTAPVTITPPPALTLSVNVTSNYNGQDISCYGASDGRAQAVAGGGTGVYFYSWYSDAAMTIPIGQLTPDAINLAAGDYFVRVMDINGCSIIGSVILDQPLALDATMTQVNVECYNANTGSITVTAVAGTGTPGYEYSINGGATWQATGTFSSLPAATYTVLVRDLNLCIKQVLVTITQPSQLSASITSITNVSCNGGNNGIVTVTATAGSGTSPYNYSIDAGATWQTDGTFPGLTAGSYSIIVRDNNLCSVTIPVLITEPSLLQLTPTPDVLLDCYGDKDGTGTFNAVGGTIPYTFTIESNTAGATFAVPGFNYYSFFNAGIGEIRVRVTDSKGCYQEATINFTQPPELTPGSIEADQVLCTGDNPAPITQVTAAAGGPGAITYQWQYATDSLGTYFNIAGASGPLANNYTPPVNATSTLYYRRMATSGICAPVYTDTIEIKVNPRPIAILTGGETICPGDSAILKVTLPVGTPPYDIVINNFGTVNDYRSNDTIYVKPLITTTYTISSVADSNACSITGPPNIMGSAIVTVRDLPVVTIDPRDTTTCEYGMVTFEVGATGSDLLYQWYVNDGSGFNAISDGGIYFGANTKKLYLFGTTRDMDGYLYHAEVTTCSTPVISGDALLTVNTIPEIRSHPKDSTICSGTGASFHVSATGTGLSFQWIRNPGTGFINVTDDLNFSGSNDSTLVITNAPASFNNNIFRVIVTGTCGVPLYSNFVILRVNVPPTVTLNPVNKPICAGGGPVYFIANGSGMIDSLRWQVNIGGTGTWTDIFDNAIYSGTTTQQLSLVNIPLSYNNNQYRLGLKAFCDTIYTNPATLTVNSNPVINFASDTLNACGGITLPVDPSPSGGSGVWTQHIWTGDIGSLSNYFVEVPNFRSLIPGPYTLNYRVRDSNGCYGDSSVVVMVDSPDATFIQDLSSMCTPDTVTFTKDMTGIASFTWNFDDGSPVNTVDDNPVHIFTNTNPTAIEYYNVSLTVVSAGGCSATYTQMTTVYPAIDATFTANTNIVCSGSSIIFTGLSGANNYYWDYGDLAGGPGSFISSHLYVNTTGAPIVRTVILTTTSFYGCTDVYTLDITVMPVPTPQFTAAPTPQTYDPAGNTVNFTNEPDPGTWNYTWRFGDGGTSALENPSHTYTGIGTYNVTLIVDNVNCRDSITHQVNILPEPPVADFDSVPSGCAPLYVVLNNTSANRTTPGTTFRWDFGDGNYSTAENPTYTYFTPGTYRIELTVTGPGGTSVYSQVVSAFVSPQAYFTVTPSLVFVNDESVRCFNLSQFADSYMWEFGDGDTSRIKEPYHKYMEEGVYDITLWAYSNNGCSDKYVLSPAVTVEPAGEVRFSTVFTPNKEGPIERTDLPTGGTEIDQFFFPPIREKVINYKLQIFNRLGVLIFESRNINVPWNGYYKGQLCPQGVYVWYVEGKYANGEPFKKVGDVTLLH